MLTRQSANSNRLETMAEEQQSGNGCASTGEVFMSAERVEGAISAKNPEIPRKKYRKKKNGDQEIHAVDNIQGSTEVNNGAKRKRGRPKLSKQHRGERSTGANTDMSKSTAENDVLMSAIVDEIPKNGDFQPSSKELMVVPFPRFRKPRSGVRRNNEWGKTTNTPLLEDRADENINQAKNSVSNGHGELSKTVDTESQYQGCHEIDHAKYDGVMIDDGDTDDDLPLSMCLNIQPPIGSDDSRAIIPNTADCHEIDHANYDGMMIDDVGDTNDDQPLSMCLNIQPPIGSDMMIDDVGDTNDDQPLSMCLNIRPPIGSDDSRALPVSEQYGNGTPLLDEENTVESSQPQKADGPKVLLDLNKRAESNDEGGELGPTAIVSMASNNTMENEESLLFVKRSSAWENIYAMETYKKMTRKPDFRPLGEQKEELREGLAFGLMINFINLMEDTSKLQLSSDITAIERGLETLNEFKPHGFDVERIEASLTQLLLKKQRAEELRKEYEHIGSKISNNVDEGKLGDEEISQLREKIREIEMELGEAKLKKENREKALSTLQSERDAIAENLERIQVEFETVVGSL